MHDKESLDLLSEAYYGAADSLSKNYIVVWNRPLRIIDVVRQDDERLSKKNANRDQTALSGLDILKKLVTLEIDSNSRSTALHNISVAAELGAFAARDILVILKNRDLTPAAARGLTRIFGDLQTNLEAALPPNRVHYPAQKNALEYLARAREYIDS